jgi:putative ABC transport system permease protein
VVLFTLIAGIVAGVLFGLGPALTACRFVQRTELTQRGGSRHARLRPVLVGLQFAAAIVLLSGAGLLMRSFHRLQQVDTGLDAERVLAGRFFLPRVTYPPERAVRLYEDMMERVSRLPGVESVSAVSAFPFSGIDANVVFQLPGRPPSVDVITANFRAATPGYFRSMGIRITEGRDIAGSDSANSPFVAVVNRAFVDRFFPGRNPHGETLTILGPKPRTIVGVVSNVRHRGLDSPPEPEIYVPHTQFPTGGMFLAIRTRMDDPAAAAAGIRSELAALDPVLPQPRFQRWTAMVDQTLAARRLSLVLTGVFAAAGLLLAATGTYGMLAFNVSQRAKEFGIRIAIGAARRDIVRTAMSGGIAPAAIGLTIGLVFALASSRLLEGLLFETAPNDPATLGSMVLLLLAAGFVASLAPVRRALRIDPAAALRQE